MEFRPMRRSRQLLTPEQAWALLEKGSYGVLAVQGDGGWPYAVPLNYACCGRSIYFHCAKAGHKLDALRAHPKVCFTVVDKSDIVSSEFTTYFRTWCPHCCPARFGGEIFAARAGRAQGP